MTTYQKKVAWKSNFFDFLKSKWWSLWNHFGDLQFWLSFLLFPAFRGWILKNLLLWRFLFYPGIYGRKIGISEGFIKNLNQLSSSLNFRRFSWDAVALVEFCCLKASWHLISRYFPGLRYSLEIYSNSIYRSFHQSKREIWNKISKFFKYF